MSRWMPRWSGLDWGQRARQGSLVCIQRPDATVVLPQVAGSSSTETAERPSRHRRRAASSASRWCWALSTARQSVRQRPDAPTISSSQAKVTPGRGR